MYTGGSRVVKSNCYIAGPFIDSYGADHDPVPGCVQVYI